MSEPITMTPAVSNLTATAISTSEIDLTWTLSADTASAIEVDRSTDGNTWDTVTDSLAGNATSFADSSALNEATHYFYRVRLIWSSGPSAFTTTADAWTLPNAPSLLSASSSGPNEVDLSWTNNSAVATQFQIERSDDGVNFYTLDTVTGTTYSDTFADDGSTYWYRVEALNDNGDLSAPSGAVSTSTALAPPSELTATAVSASEIDLAWSDDSVTATGYEVDRSTNGTNFTPLAPNLPADTSSYTDTGLAAGAHFYYRVISLAGVQFSDPSNAADDTTTPPSPDSAWAGTSTSSSVTVNWDPAQGASGYEIDRSVNSGWIDVGDITSGSATSFTDTGLLENTNFSYQIIAKNNAGQSSPIGVSATTSLEVPAIPSGVQAIALSATSVEIVWENNADNEQGFNVGYNTNGTSVYTPIGSTAAGTTKFIATNLSPGTAYFFAVQASNSEVTSGWSDPSSLVTPNLPTGSHQPPQPPTNLSATGGTNLIQLQWDPSPTPGVEYWVERQLPGGNNWGVIGIAVDTTYNDDPGVTGFTFSYRVVAANGEHTSTPTNTAQAMKPWPAPTLNLHLFTWSTDYKATVFWDPPVDPHSVDGYSFSYTTGDGATNTIPLGAGDHAVTIAAPQGDHTYSYTLVASKGSLSTTYYYLVTSVNAQGNESDASAPASATTPAGQMTATGSDLSGPEGTDINGTIATFTDSEVNTAADDYTASIDWGDGDTSAGTIQMNDSGGFDVDASHAYQTIGDQTATVTLTHTDSGRTAMATSTVHVEDPGITVEGVAIPSSGGWLALGPVARFSSVDSNLSASDFHATIDWGDGSPPTTAGISANGSSFNVEGDHAYAASGEYTIVATITDPYGGQAVAATAFSSDDDASTSGFLGDPLIGLQNESTEVDTTPFGEPGVADDGGYFGSQWGVADGLSGVTGYGEGQGEMSNMPNTRFNPSSATTQLTVGSTFDVTETAEPSSNPSLYAFGFSIENTSDSAVDMLFRLANEFLFMWQPSGSSSVAQIQDYDSTDPLTSIDTAGGAPMLQCDFGVVAPHAVQTFNLYFGTADSSSDAQSTLASVGSQIDDVADSSGNAAMFGFSGGPQYTADLQVDSNNDGTINSADDPIKDDPNKPGKVIVANTLDEDNSNKPGYADFNGWGHALATA
ncbi:MAG TPA: fibronectin type III domain-containing protein, partial [Tepidisphaeraceae bacterium]|nr:fibronectin type III domain-containing protein [Tepidisphaeraceae bacterium]